MALEIPAFLASERQDLRNELVAAARQYGLVGVSAREVAALLDAHFKKEEDILLPLIGALPALAAAEVPEVTGQVRAAAGRLGTELPALQAENRAITAAAKELAKAALGRRERRFVRLAHRIMNHAQTEEQLIFPAAALEGKYLTSPARLA